MRILENRNPGAIIIEGHVQGLSNTRSLGEVGIPIVVIDKFNCVARYSKYCQRFFYCPNYLDQSFVDFLIDLAKEQKLNGYVLIPSNDHAVVNISKNRSELEPYFKIITPSIDIIDKIYNKSNLLALAKRCEVAIPTTYNIKDSILLPENVIFPVITKGNQGLSFYKRTGKKVIFSNSFDNLKRNLNDIKEVFPVEETFTQQCIKNDGTNKTVSFTAFCINGEIKTSWMGQKIREHPIRFGTATFANSYH